MASSRIPMVAVSRKIVSTMTILVSSVQMTLRRRPGLDFFMMMGVTETSLAPASRRASMA